MPIWRSRGSDDYECTEGDDLEKNPADVSVHAYLSAIFPFDRLKIFLGAPHKVQRIF